MKALKSIRFYCLVVFTQAASLTSFAQTDSLKLQSTSAIQRLDDRIMINLANNRTPGQTGFFRFISRNNLYGNIGIPAGMFAGGLIGKDQQLRQNALFVASSTALSFVATALIKNIVKRRRPFVQNVSIVPVYRAHGFSFPSGHTSAAFATASSVSAAYPKWYVIVPTYLWAGTVGYSRMYLGVHYPSDVATGAAVGVGSTFSTIGLKK